jgi:two-component system phosphate regulon sensor histidine kinase PhoR
MQSHPSPSGSLQDVIRTSTATPELIQVKPKGLKVILQSMIEFLESMRGETILLAKLPKGQVWKEDLLRYCSDPVQNSRLYLFSRTQDDNSTLEEVGETAVHLVSITDAQAWRGEYFLVVLAPGLSGAITAYRIQAMSARRSPLPEEENGSEVVEVSHKPSQYLEVCFSVNPEFLADVLGSIQQVIAQETDTSLQWQQLQQQLQEWENFLSPSQPIDMNRIDQLLVWQLKQQERLRQSTSIYRRQALSASNLSTQNEVLMNTLRLKDDFLNNVGQELRTPLATIKTALTLLASPSLKGPQRQRYIDMVSHECDRQSTLISGVLNLLQMETSLGETRPEAVRLANTVPAIVSTYQPLAQEKGIMLAYTIPDNLPPIACPENWLRQIVIHLLHNSIKYTEHGGEVWVTASQNQDFIELEIRDTGVGISPTDLPRIFEHFYRGRNLPEHETEGAGLGLSIVQQLLMYCGGSIVVNSQPGSGSSFRTRFPLYEV